MHTAIKVAISTVAICGFGACDRTQPQEQAPMQSPTIGAPATSPNAPNSPDSPGTMPTSEHTAATKAESSLLEDPGAQDPVKITKAVAVLEPTKGSKVHGTVTFTQAADGKLKVSADISGLPKGVHAYHVHQFGDCSGEDGKSAGTHFNFSGSSENPGDDIARITGNLGELKADAKGHATATQMLDKASLQGAYTLIGRAVIVHEKANNPKEPPIGAAGSRLACGVIGMANGESQHAAAGSRRATGVRGG